MNIGIAIAVKIYLQAFSAHIALLCTANRVLRHSVLYFRLNFKTLCVECWYWIPVRARKFWVFIPICANRTNNRCVYSQAKTAPLSLFGIFEWEYTGKPLCCSQNYIYINAQCAKKSTENGKRSVVTLDFLFLLCVKNRTSASWARPPRVPYKNRTSRVISEIQDYLPSDTSLKLVAWIPNFDSLLRILFFRV